MDLLIAATCALFVQSHCASMPTSTTTGVAAWQPEIDRATANFGLPQAWVEAVIARESGGRTTLNGRPIRSSAGAMGLMQLMPKTYQDMRRQYALGADPDDPRDNIAAGTAYLRQMYVRYGYPNMFAAYNAGPGRFDDYLLRNRPLPDETIRYVTAIVPGADTVFQHANPVPKSGAPIVRNGAIASKKGALFFHSGTLNGLVSGANSMLFVALAAPHS